MIDIAALRQSHRSGELEKTGHVLSDENIADSMNKKVKLEVLDKLMTEGKIKHPVNLWIIHKLATEFKKTKAKKRSKVNAIDEIVAYAVYA